MSICNLNKYFSGKSCKMRMMLLAFVVIISLMSPLCDCYFTFQPGVGTPGYPCTSASECKFSPFTSTRQCCGGAPNGNYCSECCVDSDCPPGGFTCTPLSFLFQSLYETHARFCVKSNTFQATLPCYKNEQCKSNQCNGGLGLSGDDVVRPLGTCA